MRFWLPLLATIIVAGCRTDSAPPPQTPAVGATSARVDLAPLQGKSMSVEQFVVECQKLSGFNFTYAEPTRDALRRATIELSSPWQCSAVEFPAKLDALIAPEFHCKPVGPADLHVLLIERDPSRG